MIVTSTASQDEIADFVSLGLFGCAGEFEKYQCMGWSSGRLIAGVVFHNYYPGKSIELSGYATRGDWLTRDRIRQISAYPFEQLGCRIAVARISEQNARTRRIWRALGATETLIPDFRADGVAEAVAVIKAADWKKTRFMR